MLDFADNFLAGSLITLLIPVAAFVALVVWYTYYVLRAAAPRAEGTPEVPSPRQPASAGITATGERGTPTAGPGTAAGGQGAEPVDRGKGPGQQAQ